MTIAAISTAFGEGAIAVLRLSGPRAVEIADAVFRAKKRASELTPRLAYYGEIFDGEEKLDSVLLTVFQAPASYTSEPMVEISSHGGIHVTRRILEALLRHGARAAEPGEFTQRAFLNGKLDLTQAEAVMDLIRAQTDLALRAANEQLEGRLGSRIQALREFLLELLAHIEAYIDFPDEDIAPDTGAAILGRIDALHADLVALLATAGQGKILREGVRTVICGEPNVGKSSLLNLLTGQDRAIVNARPGTTRDVLEEFIQLRDIPLHLVDTAGIREATDEVEREGIERARRQVEQADLVLEVVDASVPRTQDLTPTSNRIFVLNKSDLGEHESWRGVDGVRVSALRGEGVDALADAILARVLGGSAVKVDWSVAINARHQACLQRAQSFIEAARKAFTDRLSPEFIAEELRAALNAVGEVVGKVDTEDLLGVIFGRFCIGK